MGDVLRTGDGSTVVRTSGALQRTIGNAQTGKVIQGPAVQRFLPDISKLGGMALVAALASSGRTREATAVKNLLAYAALHGGKGPLGDDKGFDKRLNGAAFGLAKEMVSHPSFQKLPARLKAITYSAEKLNLSPLKSGAVDPDQQQWMTSRGGVTGAANAPVPGSTGKYGESAWKCNKLVADAYLAKGGGAIGKGKFPFYSDGKWSYQANDLAARVWKGVLSLKAGKELKHFPYSELLILSKDGTAVVEVDEFDAKGKRASRYILNGGIFEKHVPHDGGWKKTKETKTPAELQPGVHAERGDMVSFFNAERSGGRRESGHTGLNLGNDLFISALNATEGIGVLSIARHIDPGAWDKYAYVGFRRFKE